MVNKAVSATIEIVGSRQELTDACEVKQPSVWVWLRGKKKVSAKNAKRIELATEGSVPACQIRPDLSDLFPYPNQIA